MNDVSLPYDKIYLREKLHKSKVNIFTYFKASCGNVKVKMISIVIGLYNMLCTVNTQHTSRQDAIITIRLYLGTCFGRKR